MFSQDDAPETIRAATRAGVSAYVVDGLDRSRIKSIIEAAIARFEEFQTLRTQLADANLKLSERRVVERAKGLLMKSRGLDEDAAYATLRKMAMDRKLKLAEVAQRVLDAADLLGA
jgi:response regulator NasT